MKRLPQFAVFAAVATTGFSVCSAQAAPSRGPVISPSVKAAHRLKYSPPRNWIRHYLGDDRYKIAGGIWKVVTTPNDKFYYPASAREMLTRSPNNVIGFSSADEAIEAGYTAHPSYDTTFSQSTVQVVSSGASNSPAVRSTGARRIALSDGASNLVLPAGWRQTQRRSQNYSGMAINIDEFRSARGQVVGFASMNLPNIPDGTDISAYMTPETMRQYSTSMSAGRVNNSGSGAFDKVTMRRAKLGGLSGLAMRPRAGSGVPASQMGEFFMVGKGSKMYMAFVQGSSKTADVRSILNSFRPR